MPETELTPSPVETPPFEAFDDGLLFEAFGQAPSVLPEWLLNADLLQAFIWYISISFAASLVLRLRFYVSVYALARHVSDSCPNVYRLIHEHWFLCVKDGLLALAGLYGVLLVAYMAMNRFVVPEAHATLSMLADLHPLVLVVNVVLVSAMVTIDTALIVQVGVIDIQRVKGDLSFAEDWLGGNLYHLLGMLGKWNPIKLYADSRAEESLLWMNEVFRDSVQVMIGQLALRILVAASLFCCYILAI